MQLMHCQCLLLPNHRVRLSANSAQSGGGPTRGQQRGTMFLGHMPCSPSSLVASPGSPTSMPIIARACESPSETCLHTGQGQVRNRRAQAMWQLWPHCQKNNGLSSKHKQMKQTAIVYRLRFGCGANRKQEERVRNKRDRVGIKTGANQKQIKANRIQKKERIRNTRCRHGVCSSDCARER